MLVVALSARNIKASDDWMGNKTAEAAATMVQCRWISSNILRPPSPPSLDWSRGQRNKDFSLAEKEKFSMAIISLWLSSRTKAGVFRRSRGAAQRRNEAHHEKPRRNRLVSEETSQLPDIMLTTDETDHYQSTSHVFLFFFFFLFSLFFFTKEKHIPRYCREPAYLCVCRDNFDHCFQNCVSVVCRRETERKRELSR